MNAEHCARATILAAEATEGVSVPRRIGAAVKKQHGVLGIGRGWFTP